MPNDHGTSGRRADGLIDAGARFSPCRRWRYTLWRLWSPLPSRLVVIGLNPSTADETQDDPTIRRCMAFAKREGFGGLVMLNMFAWRATDPREMYAAPDPVGPENDTHIAWETWKPTQPVVLAAWGVHGAYRSRDRQIHRLVGRLVCLGTTRDGYPRHPLYVRGDTPFQPLPPRRGEG